MKRVSGQRNTVAVQGRRPSATVCWIGDVDGKRSFVPNVGLEEKTGYSGARCISCCQFQLGGCWRVSVISAQRSALKLGGWILPERRQLLPNVGHPLPLFQHWGLKIEYPTKWLCTLIIIDLSLSVLGFQSKILLEPWGYIQSKSGESRMSARAQSLIYSDGLIYPVTLRQASSPLFALFVFFLPTVSCLLKRLNSCNDHNQVWSKDTVIC